jgi:hypothetical protein
MAVKDDVMRKFGPKQMEAFGLATLREVNLLRDWITDFKAAAAAATSLADFQTRIASLPDMPQRTTEQLIDAVDLDLGSIPDYNWMGVDI